MPALHQWDYLFAFGTIFAALDAYNIGQYSSLRFRRVLSLIKILLKVPMMSLTYVNLKWDLLLILTTNSVFCDIRIFKVVDDAASMYGGCLDGIPWRRSRRCSCFWYDQERHRCTYEMFLNIY